MSNLVKINEYEEFRNKVGEVKESCNFLPDVSSDEGYAKSKRVALDVAKILTAVEKKRKELKSESIAVGKAIDSEAKTIVAEIEGFMLPHKNAYKELDTLKKEREANRKQELSDRVVALRELPALMVDSDSHGIKAALEGLQQNECLDYYEFTQEALLARNASKDALGDMFARKLKEEKDAVELAKLKKEQAEREQKEREDKIASDAKAEAEAAKLEAENDKTRLMIDGAKLEQAGQKLKIDEFNAMGNRTKADADVRNKEADTVKKLSETAQINAETEALVTDAAIQDLSTDEIIRLLQ